MSAANHTAGPWTCKPTASLGPQWAVYSESDTRGATIAVEYDHDENTEANARLLAAAPDLLAALRAIEARAEGEWDHPALVAFGPLTPDTSADILALARAALRQAGV